MKKRVAILGSTGSIGLNTLRVIDHFPGHFEVVGLSAGNNIELLSEQVKRYKPSKVAILNPARVKKLKNLVKSVKVKVLAEIEGLREIAIDPRVDLVVAAMAGSGSLRPILEAVRNGKTIALANKEPMVMAGELVMNEARRWGAKIIPVDSEHSALFQCLEGKKKEEIESLILTCSGGPFYHWPKKKLSQVTTSLALRHPTWTMGKKISIDSATLMNKGLEIIEATYLFGLDLSRVKVLIHPQAMVHGLVQFIDGVLLGLMGQPDMRLAIQYALHYPERQKNAFPRLDLAKVGKLYFYPPDEKKFPSLSLAKEARKSGGTMPAVLNGANEVAVEAFLKAKLKFLRIVAVVRKVMERHRVMAHPNLKEILEADSWAREEAMKVIG